jgi:iron-sulfur cluster assembly protein CyaY
MDQQEYLRLAETCLVQVAKWLEEFDPDELDFSTADGLVTLEFPDGARFILNRQAAVSQIWFAAGARAWHYKWDATRQTWVDDKDGHDLHSKLAEVVSAKIGRPVHQ